MTCALSSDSDIASVRENFIMPKQYASKVKDLSLALTEIGITKPFQYESLVQAKIFFTLSLVYEKK